MYYFGVFLLDVPDEGYGPDNVQLMYFCVFHNSYFIIMYVC